MNVDRKERASKVFYVTDTMKLLSDPTRLRILEVLFTANRELCVNEIADAINVSPSATSHQLAKLEMKGIVRSFRDGQTMCYEICKTQLTETLRKILKVFI